MRQVGVGVLMFFLGLFADFFVEHTVKRAPEWVARLIASLFIPFGIIAVLLSDVVWPHFYGMKANPFVSTGIAALAGALVVGSLWWFWVANRQSAATPAATTTSVGASVVATQAPAPALPAVVTPQKEKRQHAESANAYPAITSEISGDTAEIFLANNTAAPIKASVRVIPNANKFDQKTLTSRPTPPPTLDLGELAVGHRKSLIKIGLGDEYEEAVYIAADLGEGTSFTKPLAYRVYFRKPERAWQFEYVLHDSYERRKLLQRGGKSEDSADRRRRVRYKLSQLVMGGNMLKQGFTWLVHPTVDAQTGQRIDRTEKLSDLSLEIQSWKAEAVFWVHWELGEEYAARLSNPTQSVHYPRGIETLAAGDYWRDRWDDLTGVHAKLEEFLKELPEL